MAKHVLLGCDRTLLLKHDRQALQYKRFRQDRITGSTVQGAAFVIHMRDQCSIAKLGQPGFRIARYANNLAAVIAHSNAGSLQFSRFTAVGNGDHHIPRYQLAAGAVHGFRAMQVIGRRSGGREQRCHIFSHMRRLANTCDMDTITLCLRVPNQLRSLFKGTVIHLFDRTRCFLKRCFLEIIQS